MTLVFHELRRNSLSLIIWSAVIAFMLGVCIVIYPEMASQMDELSSMMSDMGSFSSAFGMDQLNFGEFMGYFAIECGNTLGLGGAMFAAIVGATALAKEEKDGTAEFLLTHPISRTRIITDKLIAVILQVAILSVASMAVSFLAILAVGVEAEFGKLALVFLAFFLLQIEFAAITFGISAFMKSGPVGVGLGLVFGLYLVNILSNLTEELEVLKYITPFAYADGTHIVPEGSIDLKYLAVGLALAVLGIAAAYVKYNKKDIT